MRATRQTAPLNDSALAGANLSNAEASGVDKGGQGAQAPNGRTKKIFFVKIEGLLEPVVLYLSFRVRSNAMFTSEKRY